METPFGIKKVDGDIDFGEYDAFSLYGERFIFDPDIYVEGMAYTRLFGDEPEDHDVLLLRYTPTKLKLICVPDHTITPLEFHISDVLLFGVLPNPFGFCPFGKPSLLPAIIRIKGGNDDVSD